MHDNKRICCDDQFRIVGMPPQGQSNIEYTQVYNSMNVYSVRVYGTAEKNASYGETRIRCACK